MVKVNYLNQEFIIEDLIWRAGENAPETDPAFSKQIVEFLQALTNPNDVSGADPIPDLAIVNKLNEEVFKGKMEIVDYDQPEFDPEAIY